MSGLAVVTGGTGFVGRFLVERLLAEGMAVRVLGRRAPAEGFFSGAVEFRRFELEPEKIDTASLAGASLLVHAAFDHVPGRYRGGEGDDPAGFRRRNLDGTAALFAAAKAAGVERAVFLSSRAVYGTQTPGTVLAEETPCRPDTLYGEVKLEAERALVAISDAAFRVAILRATGVYGASAPGQANKWDGLIADWREGREIAPRAGTEVHGDDLAVAMMLALEEPAAGSCLTLNVSDLLVDHADIVEILNAATGRRSSVPARSDHSSFNAMSTDRLGSLGWRPGGIPLLEHTLTAMARRNGGLTDADV